MLYGDKKIRQMVRSVLPSRSRTASKNQKRRRRQNRRSVAPHLQTARGLHASDAIEIYENTDLDLDFYREQHHGRPGWEDLVQERRDADHVNHFIRWSKEVTRDLPIQARFDAVKAMLGPTSMSDHALSHVEYELKIDPITGKPRSSWIERYRQAQREQQKVLKAQADLIVEKVRKIAVEPKEVERLNTYLVRNIQPLRIPTRGELKGWCPSSYQHVKGGVGHRHTDECYYLVWHECNVVPQLRGYHNWRKFLRIVFEGKHKDCVGVKVHVHSSKWIETLLEYLDVHDAPTGYHRLRKHIRVVYS